MLLLLLAPVPVLANAVSQALYAKGLIHFNVERWNEAYQLFDEAARVDPNDALAAYYRGLAAGRLGFRDVAKQEIERALKLSPQLPGAPLDLGVLHFDAGEYDQAERWLRRAYEQPRDRFVAALFLGLARYRRGDDAGAHQFLTEAAKDPELRATAQYYDALVLIRQGQKAAANEALEGVKAAQPESEVGRIAAEYLATGKTTAPPGAPPAPTVAVAAPAVARPWSVYGRVAFEYDSNVPLEPDEKVVRIFRHYPDKADGRIVLGAGGSYRALQDRPVSVTGSYDFSQSVHFNLTEYDLQTHRPRIDVQTAPRWYQFGVAGWYEFDMLNYQSFFQDVVGLPWAMLYEGRVSASQLYYRVRGRDYFERSQKRGGQGGPFDPYLDALNNAVGARQIFLLGAEDRDVSFGYQFDSEDTISSDGDDFQYLGHQFDVLFHVGILGWVDTTAGYQFRYETYEEGNSRNASGFARRDRQSQWLIEVDKALTPYLSVALWYIGTVNDSNTDEFSYDRHIVSLGARVFF